MVTAFFHGLAWAVGFFLGCLIIEVPLEWRRQARAAKARDEARRAYNDRWSFDGE